MSDAWYLWQSKINHKCRSGGRFGTAVRGAALALAGLVLAGCASLVDDARDLSPKGTAFQQALYENYLDLAISRGDDWTTGDSADFYAERAIQAANGVDVVPQLVPPGAADLSAAQERLMAAFGLGAKETLPDLTGRAQVAYDCWVHETEVGAPRVLTYQCRARFLTLMGRIEVDLEPEPAPVVVAEPEEATFTVYFGFDEWFLTAEALEVLTAAIDTARAGGHGRIISAGHTDSSGPASYNDGLSVRRAEVVKITLVEMGALPEAIEIIGYGESRLAIDTGDGVREPLNRRTVVTLLP